MHSLLDAQSIPLLISRRDAVSTTCAACSLLSENMPARRTGLRSTHASESSDFLECPVTRTPLSCSPDLSTDGSTSSLLRRHHRQGDSETLARISRPMSPSRFRRRWSRSCCQRICRLRSNMTLRLSFGIRTCSAWPHMGTLEELQIHVEHAGDDNFADHANARHVLARLSGTELPRMPADGAYWPRQTPSIGSLDRGWSEPVANDTVVQGRVARSLGRLSR